MTLTVCVAAPVVVVVVVVVSEVVVVVSVVAGVGSSSKNGLVVVVDEVLCVGVVRVVLVVLKAVAAVTVDVLDTVLLILTCGRTVWEHCVSQRGSRDARVLGQDETPLLHGGSEHAGQEVTNSP